MITNIYELKSRIWFWEEYIHFERFIANLDLTDAREISPKYSKDNEKQKCVFKIFFP